MEGNAHDILEARRRRLTAAGQGLSEEMELTALLSPDGRIEPPSEGLLVRMLALPRSDREELAAIFGMMALEADGRAREGRERHRRA